MSDFVSTVKTAVEMIYIRQGQIHSHVVMRFGMRNIRTIDLNEVAAQEAQRVGCPVQAITLAAIWERVRHTVAELRGDAVAIVCEGAVPTAEGEPGAPLLLVHVEERGRPRLLFSAPVRPAMVGLPAHVGAWLDGAPGCDAFPTLLADPVLNTPIVGNA